MYFITTSISLAATHCNVKDRQSDKGHGRLNNKEKQFLKTNEINLTRYALLRGNTDYTTHVT